MAPSVAGHTQRSCQPPFAPDTPPTSPPQHTTITHTCTNPPLLQKQEAGSRAIEADEQGRTPDALKLYQTALEIIAEGLALQVTVVGGCWLGVDVHVNQLDVDD